MGFHHLYPRHAAFYICEQGEALPEKVVVQEIQETMEQRGEYSQVVAPVVDQAAAVAQATVVAQVRVPVVAQTQVATQVMTVAQVRAQPLPKPMLSATIVVRQA